MIRAMVQEYSVIHTQDKGVNSMRIMFKICLPKLIKELLQTNAH